MCKYCTRRGDVYYYVHDVPRDLWDVVGKRIIKKSLKTGNKREAAPMALAMAMENIEHWRKLRAGDDAPLDQTDLDRMMRAFLDRRIKENAQKRVRPPMAALYAQHPELREMPALERPQADITTRQLFIEELDLAIRTGETTYTHNEIIQFIWDNKLNIKEGSTDYYRIAQAIGEGILGVEQAALEGAKGNILGEKLAHQTLVPPLPPEPEPVEEPEPQTSPKLSEIFDLWKAEHLGAGSPPKTVGEFWTQMERFIDMHGDIPVHEVMPAMVRDFKDAMLAYPKHLKNAEKALPLDERLALGAAEDRATLSPRSVNDKCLGAVAAVLGYAASNQYIQHNPAAGIKVKVAKVSTRPNRLPYSAKDMKKIFNFPIYTKGHRPVGGAGEAAYWLPLLATYTGARLEEMGQLLVEDVKRDKGIWYFDMLNLDDQSQDNARHFKTEHSKRLVPIHSMLIKLGFLDYVKKRKDAGDARLFPLVKSANPDSQKTGPFSQWWGRYARKHGGFGAQKVFHSFRHAAKTAFRESGVQENVYDAIQGHAAQSEGRKYGEHTLKTLAAAMEKLSYDVDLGHLIKAK